jgi:hypothetical protein
MRQAYIADSAIIAPKPETAFLAQKARISTPCARDRLDGASSDSLPRQKAPHSSVALGSCLFLLVTDQTDK